MNNSLEVLFLRRPKFDYISPAICEAIFSSSGGPVIVLNPLTPQVFPTGVVLGGVGGFQLNWDAYPGALCYSVYKADSSDPFGSYTIVAECIPSPTFNIEPFGTGCYRVSAITGNGETPLSLPDCTSGTGPPFVTTQPADGIGASSANLHGRAIPNGESTTAFFEWGFNTSYGNTTTPTSVGAGLADVPFSFVLTGLAALTQYHFRAVASNINGTVTGGDMTFVTGSSPISPLWNIGWDAPTISPGSPAFFSNVVDNPTQFHISMGQNAVFGGGSTGFLLLNGGQTFTGPSTNCNLHLSILGTSNTVYSLEVQVDAVSVLSIATPANSGIYDFPFTVPASVGAAVTIAIQTNSGDLFNPTSVTLDGTFSVI